MEQRGNYGFKIVKTWSDRLLKWDWGEAKINDATGNWKILRCYAISITHNVVSVLRRL